MPMMMLQIFARVGSWLSRKRTREDAQCKMMLNWQDQRHPSCSMHHFTGSAAQIHACELSFPSCTSTKRKCCEFQYQCLQKLMRLHCDFSGPQHPHRNRDSLGLHTGPATTGNCQKGEKMTLHRKTVGQYGLTLWHVFSNSVLIVLLSLIRFKSYVTRKTSLYSVNPR